MKKTKVLSQIYFYNLKAISSIEEGPNLEMSYSLKFRDKPEF